MSSEFIASKIAIPHGAFSVRNDGLMTSEDFDALADRYIELGTTDPEQAQNVRAVFKKVYATLLEETAKTTPLTSDVVAECLAKADAQQLTELMGQVGSTLFDAIDTDKDDFIGPEEFAVFHKIMGLDPDKAADAFNALDTIKDGKLSREEFVAAAVDFVTSNDQESSSKHFCGKLL